jgi:hypothetical protein
MILISHLERLLGGSDGLKVSEVSRNRRLLLLEELEARTLLAIAASAAPLGPLVANNPFSGVVATFTDTDASSTATIDWGDGTTSTGAISANASGGYNVTGSHTFAQTGTVDVAITITDSSENSATVHAGPVAWWRGEGNTMDSTGNNPGASQGTVAYSTGQVGEAFSLDGIAASVNAGNPSDLQLSSGDFSIAAWVNFSSLTHPPGNMDTGPVGDMSIVDKIDTVNGEVNADGWRILKQDDNHLWFSLGGGTVNGATPNAPTTVRSTTVVSTNTWYYVVATKNSTTFAIYVNGIREAFKPLPSFTDTNKVPLLIGANTPEGSHLDGLVDEVTVYNQALSAADIQALYQAGRAGLAQPMLVTTAPGFSAAAAKDLVSSSEYFTNLVSAFYQQVLHRQPDSAGAAFWVSQLQHGVTDEQLEANLLSSTEYVTDHGGGGSTWVTGVYNDLLGRAPDAGGNLDDRPRRVNRFSRWRSASPPVPNARHNESPRTINCFSIAIPVPPK